MTLVRYLTAEEWGMTWARPPASETKPDPECYVHHVGGAAWMDGTAEETFRDLNLYAQTGKGYSALDYDALVHYHRDSDTLTIGEGRGEWRSAATLDRNEQGEAIVVCGNFSLREPLPVEIEGVALGIVWMIGKGWLAADCEILGHRDNPAHPGATGCPGDLLYPLLGQVVRRVDGLLHPAEHPNVIDPPTSEEDDMSKSTITRWAGEPYDIEVSTPTPGSFARVWRGISAPDAAALIAAGLAVDARHTPIPLGMKGDTSPQPPNKYRRVG